jgi:hypothetical protein
MSLDGMGHIRRANNRESSPRILAERGVSFESKNEGAHLIVTIGGMVVDFWPGTGKFITRGAKPKTGRGVFNLLKLEQTK